MTTTVTESTIGNKKNGATDMVLPERLSVRRLIQLYIDHQIEQYRPDELSCAPISFFLSAPEEAELNEKQTDKGKAIAARKFDRPKLHDRAWNAFQQNQFVLLVDEKQSVSLDDEVTVHPHTSVRFLKLTPLVGG